MESNSQEILNKHGKENKASRPTIPPPPPPSQTTKQEKKSINGKEKNDAPCVSPNATGPKPSPPSKPKTVIITPTSFKANSKNTNKLSMASGDGSIRTSVVKGEKLQVAKPSVPIKPVVKKESSLDEACSSLTNKNTNPTLHNKNENVSSKIRQSTKGELKVLTPPFSKKVMNSHEPSKSVNPHIDSRQSFNFMVELNKAANLKVEQLIENPVLTMRDDSKKTPPKPPSGDKKPNFNTFKMHNNNKDISTSDLCSNALVENDDKSKIKNDITDASKSKHKVVNTCNQSKYSVSTEKTQPKPPLTNKKPRLGKTEHQNTNKKEATPTSDSICNDNMGGHNNDHSLKNDSMTAQLLEGSKSPSSHQVKIFWENKNRKSKEHKNDESKSQSEKVKNSRGSKKERKASFRSYTGENLESRLSGSKFYIDPLTAEVKFEPNTSESSNSKLEHITESLESKSTRTDNLSGDSKSNTLSKDNGEQTLENMTESSSLTKSIMDNLNLDKTCDSNGISPPVPRKEYRDSNVLSTLRDTSPVPIAPLRKKKTTRSKQLDNNTNINEGQLSEADNKSICTEPQVKEQHSQRPNCQRLNSLSFTTEDMDIFQKRMSSDINLDEQVANSTQKQVNPENDRNSHKGSLHRKTSGRKYDRDKRRSKSVGAPGFNIFGIKLKQVKRKSEDIILDVESEKPGEPKEVAKPDISEKHLSKSWLHNKLNSPLYKQQLNVASGAYDNNFQGLEIEQDEAGQCNSLPDQEATTNELVYENIDRESKIYGDIEVKKNEAGRNDLTNSNQQNTLNRYTVLTENDESNTGSSTYSPLHSLDIAQSNADEVLVNTSVTEENDKTPPNELDSPVPLSESEMPPGRHATEHEYHDIDTPPGTLGHGISTENLYDEIDLEEQKPDSKTVQNMNDDKNLHKASSLPKEDTLSDSHTKLSDVSRRKPSSSSHSDDHFTVKLERKLSRKLSRKVSRKLSRKMTRRCREEKYAHLKKMLIEQDSYEETQVQDGEMEDLEFSETDSEFDDDSFTDESDAEFERELVSQFNEEAQDAIAEIYQSGMPRVQRIAYELLTTEKSYVNTLALLDQKFNTKIIHENRLLKMFPNETIPQMFSNIKSIYQFHHDFLLPQLQKRMNEWDKQPKIGDVMKKFAPFLKLYTEYVQNFDRANEVINHWMEKSPKFESMITEIQKSPECENLTLQHHMLGPIQRVPRYEMLLKDYQKHLAEDSDDKEDTEKALKDVTDAAKHSNETMRKNEKFRKLLDLNQALGGTFNLVSPTRELVKEGKIIKIAARNGLLQERYLFLFNDFLLVCQSIPVTLIQQYKIKAKMEIEGMQVLEGDNLETPNTFYVKTKHKILEFHTQTSEEKLEWQMLLWNVIVEYTKKLQSRGELKDFKKYYYDGGDENLGKHPPKWIKDNETSQCMLCTVVFTLLRRRHHCRACGKVVCGKCSNYETKLEYDNNKNKRVCSDCFMSLDKGTKIISHPVLTHQPSPRRRGILHVRAIDKSVQSGYLVMTQDKKDWNKRYFAIHQDFVLYSFKAHQDVKALTSLPLPGWVVAEITETDEIDKQHVFKLSHSAHTGGMKTYFLQADDKATKDRWISVLKFVVQAELPSTGVNLDRSESVI